MHIFFNIYIISNPSLVRKQESDKQKREREKKKSSGVIYSINIYCPLNASHCFMCKYFSINNKLEKIPVLGKLFSS